MTGEYYFYLGGNKVSVDAALIGQVAYWYSYGRSKREIARILEIPRIYVNKIFQIWLAEEGEVHDEEEQRLAKLDSQGEINGENKAQP